MLARRVHHQTCIHCGCQHSQTLNNLNLFRNALEDEMNIASSTGREPLWHVYPDLNSVLDRTYMYHHCNFPLTPIPCDMTFTYRVFTSVLGYPVLDNTGVLWLNTMSDACAESFCQIAYDHHHLTPRFRNPSDWYQMVQLTDETPSARRTYRFSEAGWQYSYLDNEPYDERTLPELIPNNPRYINAWDRERRFY